MTPTQIEILYCISNLPMSGENEKSSSYGDRGKYIIGTFPKKVKIPTRE